VTTGISLFALYTLANLAIPLRLVFSCVLYLEIEFCLQNVNILMKTMYLKNLSNDGGYQLKAYCYK